MKLTSKILTLSLAGLLALPLSTFALPPLVEVKTDASGSWLSAVSGTTSASSGTVSRTKAATRSSNGYSGQGEWSCSASFGVLRTYGSAQVSSSQNSSLFYSFASAKFRDNRVTDAPGRTGQFGIVKIKYTVSGSTTLSAPPAQVGGNQSTCAATVSIRVDGGGIQGYTQKRSADGNPTCGSAGCVDFLNVEQTATYPVRFGTPYDFEVYIESFPVLYSYPGFNGQAAADLGHTMTWGGIVSVTDAGGNPITNYSDTSASGINYVDPILPQCAAPSGALTGWWPGDNHARDIQGALNGTLENGAGYAAGRVGQAFSFASAGARVHVPHSAAIDFNATQDYTIDFWMKAGPQTASGGTLVEKNGGTYPYSVKLLPTGQITAATYDGTTTVSVTSTGGSGADGVVHDNVWHHIAAVFKHSTKVLELYVDGSLNASQTYTATLGPVANGQDLYFGARSDSSNSFNGSLDEVDISSGALGLAEIQTIVAAANLGKCRAPLVANSVVSRKTHGAAGDFDIPLPVSGTPAVECRSGGATGDYQIVVNFGGAVEVTGSPQAGVTTGVGDIGSGGVANGGGVVVNGSSVTIPLTNVTNAQTLIVNLMGVSNGATTADFAIPMSVLIGDTTGNGSVSGSDIGQVKAASGQAVSGSNFRLDVNVSGGNIGASDIGLVKSRSGTQLPPTAPSAATTRPAGR